MWWLIPVFGLLLGAYFGQYLDIEIPAGMVKYFSIGIMAALDSVFGGVKALYEKNYDSLLMLSGFFTNALLAAALAYIGDMLGIDLYYAAVFAFGVRLFSNLSMIRVYIVGNLRDKDRVFREHRRVMARVAAVRADDEDDFDEDDFDEDDFDGDEDDVDDDSSGDVDINGDDDSSGDVDDVAVNIGVNDGINDRANRQADARTGDKVRDEAGLPESGRTT